MIGNMNLTARGKLLWLAGALLMGCASQFCLNYGICAAPLQ